MDDHQGAGVIARIAFLQAAEHPVSVGEEE